jgi:hypothetical protein
MQQKLNSSFGNKSGIINGLINSARSIQNPSNANNSMIEQPVINTQTPGPAISSHQYEKLIENRVFNFLNGFFGM